MTVVRVLDIGEVAAKSGVSVSALRYYEEKGLIRSTGRSGLRRLFSAQVLVQLEFIALGRQAGFSLQEMGGMIAGNGRLKIDRKRLLQKALEVEQSIRRLTSIRDGLRHVAQCGAPSHWECPKFQKLLRVAGKNRLRSRKT